MQPCHLIRRGRLLNLIQFWTWKKTPSKKENQLCLCHPITGNRSRRKNLKRSRTGTRSRSRRSWIWNQFFVIEEYSGPEPVLIGRVRKLY
uniref:Uncharacterized protein n=1 Tax=Hucho hucho TaxID=62062 RepID=A0A4W5RNQ3_9TELE